MKFRKKEERVDYTESLLNQREELTAQLLEESSKAEPDEARLTELLSRRDSLTREISSELDFLKNLDWLKGGIRTIASSCALFTVGTLVMDKLKDK
jgi:hypothetical protein